MPDIIAILKKECGDLYQKGVTIVRTLNGKFEHMPWEILYLGMEELTRGHGYVGPFNLSIRVQVEYVTLWRDIEGRVYVAPAEVPVANCIPSDFPFESSKDEPVACKPIYFEELSSEIAEKLIQELSKK